MTILAISESQRMLLGGLATGTVLEIVPSPVLVLGNDGTAWLNNSVPLMPGMRWSEMTTWTSLRPSSSSASFAFVAVRIR